MKRFAVVLTLILLPAIALTQTFQTTLRGSSEFPGPGDPDAQGLGSIEITGTTITFAIVVVRIGTPTAAHIHRGAAGTSGDIVVNFNPTFIFGFASGAVTATPEIINQIQSNPAGFYINVHNAEFPDGAVRGQLGVTPSSVGSNVRYLPVAGKVAGAAGTNFVSDLRIVNRGTTNANVTLEFFASNPAGLSGPTATSTVQVSAGEQEIIDDLLTRFGLASGLGAVRIASDQPVLATERVINDLRATGQGTTGFAFDAQEILWADSADVLPFLHNASTADINAGIGFRTNIGYFNPNAVPTTVTFNAHRSPDGSVFGTQTLTVPALSHVQQPVFQLISSVAEADRVQPNFVVSWTSGLPIFVYATVTDNKTGDGMIID